MKSLHVKKEMQLLVTIVILQNWTEELILAWQSDPNLLFESSLTGIFCWNPLSQSSAIQINTVADPDRKTFNPIFSRWQWWMAVCFYLFGFPGNGVLLSLVITWSALAYRPAQWPCTLPDRYSGGFTHCLHVMSAGKKLNFTTLLGVSFLKLCVFNLWQTLGTGVKKLPGKADTSHTQLAGCWDVPVLKTINDLKRREGERKQRHPNPKPHWLKMWLSLLFCFCETHGTLHKAIKQASIDQGLML